MLPPVRLSPPGGRTAPQALGDPAPRGADAGPGAQVQRPGPGAPELHAPGPGVHGQPPYLHRAHQHVPAPGPEPDILQPLPLRDGDGHEAPRLPAPGHPEHAVLDRAGEGLAVQADEKCLPGLQAHLDAVHVQPDRLEAQAQKGGGTAAGVLRDGPGDGPAPGERRRLRDRLHRAQGKHLRSAQGVHGLRLALASRLLQVLPVVGENVLPLPAPGQLPQGPVQPR